MTTRSSGSADAAHDRLLPATDPWARLFRLRAQPEHCVVGLMSGTSADGIDAVLVRLKDAAHGVAHEVLAFHTFPYSRTLSDRVLGAAAASAREITALDAELGRAFAHAVVEIAMRGGIPPSAIDYVGSHGQTIFHLPPSGEAPGATMQIGCAAVIAAEVGCPVVSDFRSRDMALGGQGAPLVPLVDHLLFAKPGENRVLLNIGGIANLSTVNGNEADVFAFDTGPGNALLDALMRLATKGQERFDAEGARGSRGRVLEPLLAQLLADPFLERDPPKSADRDAYGEALATRLLAQTGSASLDDLLATAAAFTAESILRAIARLPAPFQRIDRLIGSGGGIYNRAIWERLRAQSRFVVETTTDHGLDPDAKEAVAFAVLARQTVLGRPGNLPRVTGARQRAVLGSITL